MFLCLGLKVLKSRNGAGEKSGRCIDLLSQHYTLIQTQPADKLSGTAYKYTGRGISASAVGTKEEKYERKVKRKDKVISKVVVKDLCKKAGDNGVRGCEE